MTASYCSEALQPSVPLSEGMATLTQPTQRRGKSVQYGALADHDNEAPSRAARVDVVDEDEMMLNSNKHPAVAYPSNLLDDDPRVRNKGDLYTLPSNGLSAKVDRRKKPIVCILYVHY